MKKVLSLAIAAALVAPAAAMADATLFGKAHFIVQNTDYSSRSDTNSNGLADEDGDAWSVDSIHSRVGVKGAEDLGNGLKAVYHFEFKVNSDAGSGLGDRNQFVGLAGGFGTFLMGTHDTPLKMSQGKFDEFGDLPNGDIASVMPGEDRVDNVLAYVSPAMGGFTFVGAVVSGEGGDGTAAAGTNLSTPGASDALTGLFDHISIAGLYSNGPIFASLAYNSYDLGAAYTTSDPSLIRGTFIWNGGNWQVGGMFNSMDMDGATDALLGVAAPNTALKDADSYGISGHFKVGGAGKIKAQYLQGDNIPTRVSAIGFSPNVAVSFGDSEVTQFSVGYEHALSSRTTVHAGYTVKEIDNKAVGALDPEEKALFGGIIHNF